MGVVLLLGDVVGLELRLMMGGEVRAGVKGMKMKVVKVELKVIESKALESSRHLRSGKAPKIRMLFENFN